MAGIEIAGSTYLDKIPGLADKLPDWAKGLGVSANYTYIDGEQELYQPFKMPYCPGGASTIAKNLYGCDLNGLPFTDLPVPYMSKSAFNLGCGTSADPTRIAANGGVAPTDVHSGLPVWQEAVGQWDLGVNYKFSEHMWGSFNVSNLTNVVTRQTHQQAIGSTGRTWYDPGRSFRMSVGYTF